ncbi:MAG: hypothetical protein JSV27_04675 [Candidatus Bathyarchaeota archaeon]|nr:MAG: hypothetical protein JSV27_04675 [Candidatus Bathyarchaeota archaeon]
MVDYQALSIICAGLSIAASIAYYASVLRNANKTQQMQLETRRTQAFMELTNELHQEKRLIQMMELYKMDWEDYDDFERKYGSDRNIENFGKRYPIWYFYNRIGWLLHEGVIDVKTVNAITAQFTLWMWDKFKSVILKQREIYNLPDFCIWFEYLAGEIERYRDEIGISTEIPKGYGSYPVQDP